MGTRTLSRSYHVKLSACHIIPGIFGMRPLLPRLHRNDALNLYDLEDAVRIALLKRVRTVTRREPPRIEIEIEQGTCTREYYGLPITSEQESLSWREKSVPGG